MANTINVNVNKSDGWKAVKTSPSAGVFSCGSSYEFCQLDTPPADDFVGHRVTNALLVNYTLTTETHRQESE